MKKIVYPKKDIKTQSKDTSRLDFVNNYSYIIGVDEVGWGAIAGPITVGGVLLPTSFYHKDIKDSKRIKSERKKANLFEYIKQHGFVSIQHGYPYDEATKPAMMLNFLTISTITNLYHQLSSLYIEPDEVVIVVDGSTSVLIQDVESDIVCLPKADQLITAVSAASICAKTVRDTLMKELAGSYPQYGFEKHKGYCTKGHAKSLKEHGPCAIHRPYTSTVQEVL